MKRIYFVLIANLLFACLPSQKNSVEELFEADRNFSAAAEEIGFNKAFIEFAHSDAVLLRDNNMPLVGKTAIRQLFENANSQGVHFTWKPLAGDIAKSGEMGYTYGIYTLNKDTVVEKGTYVSIWKKDVEGNWKYVLDSGNEGID